ncbi:hypothetical protein [Mycolicibacter virginiensis]|uniref:hypothetical protein n=1 Tax=Mycolicibacter virginiensis TaxID=1795032 RepID=UPI001F0431E7|nr:hypothetical protein [Mycolicibacter virginiensis]ULP48606.1 hypothetical protein MJO54_05715 [Mycolicibacter virginiensis]
MWFGVNPVGRHVRQGRKGGEGDITRVRALFADFDVKPGKSLDTLDQCGTAARTLADYLGASPVALIESGHGLQPIWRVGSPRGDSNVIDRDRSRDELREIWWRFGAVAQEAARSAMWSPDGAQNARTIDGVFNLDRVLRCPGSVNWKNPDEPVPVRTRLYAGGPVALRGLVDRLDRDGVRPLAAVRPTDATVETSWGEATEWVTRQPGAELPVADLQQLSPNRALGMYLDTAQLVRVIADGDGGAHRTMVAKVLHAVYCAQEGRAGLVLALNNIGSAYLEVMEARACGEMAGDARPLATAVREIESAVVGAVAKARGRTAPRVRGRHPRRPARPRRPIRGRCV